MNMTKDLCELLDDYLAKDLPAERAHQFESHLETCEECRLAIDDWASLRRTLRQETELLETPSPQLLERLDFAFANQGPDHRRQRQWLRAGALVAACVLLVMLMRLAERPAPIIATVETSRIETITLSPPENISFPDDVIGVPIDIGDPNVTVVWLYQTGPVKHGTD